MLYLVLSLAFQYWGLFSIQINSFMISNILKTWPNERLCSNRVVNDDDDDDDGNDDNYSKDDHMAVMMTMITTTMTIIIMTMTMITVPGEFPAQRPVTRSFDVSFDLRLNKRLSKQSWGWWFETLSCPLWRHCNARADSRHYPIVNDEITAWIRNCETMVCNDWSMS